MCRLSSVFVFATLLCVTIACHMELVSADQKLIALKPKEVRDQFIYNNATGQMYAEPSLFGLPNYQADIRGIVKIDSTNANNAQGCLDYSQSLAPLNSHNETDPNAPPAIALVLRGGCTFLQKALKATAAGASAMIVYSYDDQVPLPKMSGGDDAQSIKIPAAIITHTDGMKLLSGVNSWIAAQANNQPASPFFEGVWASFSYSLIAPDDRVEFDLYTYPDEEKTSQFIMEFADVVGSLGKAAYFTPHYRIVDGANYGCTLDVGEACTVDNLLCGSQCTNCGQYCRLDPNGDLNTQPNGADQVLESAIGKCLWQIGVNQGNPTLWWEYVNERSNTLACTRQKPYRGVDCSKDAMRLVGLNEVTIQSIIDCTGDLGATTSGKNALLEAELEWARIWQPLTSPYLFVNNMTYFGGYQCPAPAGPSTCGPLSMICQGYLTNTAPPLCGSVNTNGCDIGIERDACGVCGGPALPGTSCDAQKSSSFPIGPVIGVVIACCVLIGAAVYYYMRRQNTRMRDDIDSLLKQYLPLDGSTSNNGNTASLNRPGKENANLRLIGNLEASDEATDL